MHGMQPRLSVDWRQLLDRIGAPVAEPSLQTLHALQRRALAALPFENLDIHLDRMIQLDPRALHEKIVLGGRGGFCYELNECFLRCLRCLGYEAYRMEARVELGGPGAPFDHQWILVRIDGARWYVDVGFGDFSLAPLDLDCSEPQTDGVGTYQVRHGAIPEIYRLHADASLKMLTLNLTPQEWSSFEARCHWHQTSPASAFIKKRMCTMATRDGRMTLTGNTLRTTAGSRVVEEKVPEEEYLSVLEDCFGIRLTQTAWVRRP